MTAIGTLRLIQEKFVIILMSSFSSVC